MLAIFNFPVKRDRHVENAVLSAIALQERCAMDLSFKGGEGDTPIGVGVGIHTPELSPSVMLGKHAATLRLWVRW